MHHVILVVVILSLIISGISLFMVSDAKKDIKEIKSAIVPQTISIDDFLEKLTGHDEAKAYVGISPLNIVEISTNNLPNLQTQIAGLDASFLKSFLVQYSDAIVIYDYGNDIVKGTVQLKGTTPAQFEAEFSSKFYAHPEVKDLEGQESTGGQLDQATLATLQQQFPEVYANAKVGDFLLRYPTKLIIYDYGDDQLVNIVDLG